MVKTYVRKDGIKFKGLQYTGKNAEEFNEALNSYDSKLGLFIRVGAPTPIIEDANSISFMLYNEFLEVKKSEHLLYSRDAQQFGVFNNGELKREFEQVK